MNSRSTSKTNFRRNGEMQRVSIFGTLEGTCTIFSFVVSRILDIKDSKSAEVVVCGILFKNMKLKPQVLDKYLSKKASEKELQMNKNRVSDDDSIFLEDEGTRIQLTGEGLNVKQLVSGMQRCVAFDCQRVTSTA